MFVVNFSIIFVVLVGTKSIDGFIPNETSEREDSSIDEFEDEEFMAGLMNYFETLGILRSHANEDHATENDTDDDSINFLAEFGENFDGSFFDGIGILPAFDDDSDDDDSDDIGTNGENLSANEPESSEDIFGILPPSMDDLFDDDDDDDSDENDTNEENLSANESESFEDIFGILPPSMDDLFDDDDDDDSDENDTNENTFPPVASTNATSPASNSTRKDPPMATGTIANNETTSTPRNDSAIARDSEERTSKDGKLEN